MEDLDGLLPDWEQKMRTGGEPRTHDERRREPVVSQEFKNYRGGLEDWMLLTMDAKKTGCWRKYELKLTFEKNHI